MPDYVIVNCKAEHVRHILPLLRDGDREEVEATGIHLRHHVFALWRNSSICRAALIDGEIAAIWGCVAPMAASAASMWLLTSATVEKLPLAFFRETRREIAEVLDIHPVLRSEVGGFYSQAIRFFQMLGFVMGPPKRYWNTGKFYREMRLERDMPRQVVERTSGPHHPFVIYALPRSRTAWLSAFLSYGDWACFHEQAIFMRSPEDIRGFFARPNIGTAETAAGQAWPLIHHYIPSVRAIVVRRPVEDTVAAMISAGNQVGVAYDEEALLRVTEYGERTLERISQKTGAMTLNYSDLDSESAIAELFEYCLPYRFDPDWHQWMAGQNVQTDILEFFRYYRRERDNIEAAKRTLKSDLIRLCRSGELLHA